MPLSRAVEQSSRHSPAPRSCDSVRAPLARRLVCRQPLRHHAPEPPTELERRCWQPCSPSQDAQWPLAALRTMLQPAVTPHVRATRERSRQALQQAVIHDRIAARLHTHTAVAPDPQSSSRRCSRLFNVRGASMSGTAYRCQHAAWRGATQKIRSRRASSIARGPIPRCESSCHSALGATTFVATHCRCRAVSGLSSSLVR